MRQVTILHTTSEAGLAMRLQSALSNKGYLADPVMLPSYEFLFEKLPPEPFDPPQIVKLVLLGEDADAIPTGAENPVNRCVFVFVTTSTDNSNRSDLKQVELANWDGDANSNEFFNLLATLQEFFGDRFSQPTVPGSFGEPLSPPASAPAPMPRPSAAPPPIMAEESASRAQPKSRIIGFSVLPIIVIAILIGVIIGSFIF